MGDFLLVNDHAASVVGVYDTEDDALAAVAHGIGLHGGTESARHLTLQRQSHAGRLPDVPIATGEELARRALERFPDLKTA